MVESERSVGIWSSEANSSRLAVYGHHPTSVLPLEDEGESGVIEVHELGKLELR